MSAVLGWLEHLMGSPVIYPILFAVSLIDAVVPIFPSEAPLIMAGVYAGSEGRPNLLLAMLAAFLGALAGDHLAYLIGRKLAPRIDRIDPASRRGRALARASDLLDRRGGMALVIARFIPWGRIATTIVLGATRYPQRRFTAWDALGVALWAAQGCLVGYIGGAAFEHDPIKGLALGLALAIVVSALIEGVRWTVERRSRSADRSASAAARADSGVQ